MWTRGGMLLEKRHWEVIKETKSIQRKLLYADVFMPASYGVFDLGNLKYL